MADAVSTFTVRGTANVDDAVRGLQRVGDAAENAGDASQSFESQIRGMSTGLINAEDAATLLTTATNSMANAISGADSDLRGMGTAADSAATGVNNLNDNVQLLANLQVAETVKSIGGTFMELSGHLRAVEDGLRATADTIADPFIARMAEGGAAVASFGSIAFEVAGTGLELGSAVAQIVSILPQLTTITAAVTAGFAAAKTAVLGFITTMSVATAGIGAAVIAIGYGIERYIAYREQVALTNEAMAEAARQTERNAETLRDYFDTFAQQTDQAEIMAGIQEQSAQAQNDANTYIARTIALRAEELGAYDDEIDNLERIELLNDAKMAFMETAAAQLQIESMLLGGVSEQEVARVLNLQFQAEAAALTTDELRTWLQTLPLINQELQFTEEQTRRTFELYAGFLDNFLTGDAIEPVTESTRTYTSAIREQAKNLEEIIRLQEIEAGIAIKREEFMAVQIEQQMLLNAQLKEASVIQQIKAENEAIAEEKRAIEQEMRDAELIELEAYNQRRMDLLFGGGDFESLSKDFQADLSSMSENGAASLGVLNSAMQDMAVGFMSSMTSAITSGERIDKALKKALSGMLKTLGSTYLAQGTALMIPPPYNPQGNPAAGKVMLGVGAGMLALGMAFGGGGKPSGGGGGGGGGGDRSVGESSGIMPAESTRRQGPLSLIDYTGVTIVTNDTDSMRTLINQTSRTEQLGGNSRV